MTRRSQKLVSFGAVLLAALGTSPRASSSGPDAAAAGSAAPSGSAKSTEPLAAIVGADIPMEASFPPKPSEWKDGKAVRVNRGLADPCKFTLLREWLRIECNLVGGGLVAGDPKDVTAF